MGVPVTASIDPTSIDPTDLRAPELPPTTLAARAAAVLRDNDTGTLVTASPKLYPHMWSWDAAFIAIGLAHLDVNRALTELDTLLSAQWSDGMIPHIVFTDATSYFPGPDRWAPTPSHSGHRTCAPPASANLRYTRSRCVASSTSHATSHETTSNSPRRSRPEPGPRCTDGIAGSRDTACPNPVA